MGSVVDICDRSCAYGWVDQDYWGAHMTALPFSRRATTSIAIFACLFAARHAQKLTKDPATLGALNLEHAQLFHLYRQILHQDVANQKTVLDGIIDRAAIAIGALNTTVQAMPTPIPPSEDQFALSDIKIVVANALVSVLNVQSDE
jgi:hypothetical protein